jgi:hypothetical protein
MLEGNLPSDLKLIEEEIMEAGEHILQMVLGWVTGGENPLSLLIFCSIKYFYANLY